MTARCAKLGGLINLNDGKIAGIVPVEKLSAGLKEVGVPDFLVKQVEEHAKIAKLKGALSDSDVLVLTYRLKSTRQIIDPADVEMAFRVQGVRDQKLSTPPDLGITVRITAPGGVDVEGDIEQPTRPASQLDGKPTGSIIQ